MNDERKLIREAEQVIRGVLVALPGMRVRSHPKRSAQDWAHFYLEAQSGRTRFRFSIDAKSRVTPQTALSVCERLRQRSAGTIPVVYAPVVSPRVAEILRACEVGYVDRAGNCWLRSPDPFLLIERQGRYGEPQPTPTAADPFSPKSSRVVRAMLSRPMDGWQVRQLAAHPDVQVAAGLVVKVKRALIEQGYAVERERKLYLRDPIGLLNAWAAKYSGPAEQIPLYLRGDAEAAEYFVVQWCRENAISYALGAFSAGWRLAPEVRYNVAAVYLEDRSFDQELQDQLAAKYGATRVDTGANMYLWRPFDRSVFAGSIVAGKPALSVTSALQTYLDLKRSAGRGEDAANAVFEKHLAADFRAVALREVRRRADV